MPTAGKLAAAVLFALIFWSASTQALQYYIAQDEALPLWFHPVNTGLAIVLGWIIAGSRAGRAGWMGAISYGLTAGISIAVACLFAQSFVRMIQLSLRRYYDGPGEAVVGVFGLMYDNALIVGRADVVLTILLGSILAGLAIEWTGRHFS